MPPIRDLEGPQGRLEALIDEPPGQARAAAVLAHPHPQHGGTMHTKAVYQSAKGLARAGCAVLRFNFRGVGGSQGAFGEGVGEREDFSAALGFMTGRYPGIELWAAGFSFGAWIALEAGASDPRVAALIALAAPVGQYDLTGVTASDKAKFFIHGDRDELFPLPAVRRFYAQLREPKELVVIEDADHLFEGKTLEVGDAVEDLLSDFSASAANNVRI